MADLLRVALCPLDSYWQEKMYIFWKIFLLSDVKLLWCSYFHTFAWTMFELFLVVVRKRLIFCRNNLKSEAYTVLIFVTLNLKHVIFCKMMLNFHGGNFCRNAYQLLISTYFQFQKIKIFLSASRHQTYIMNIFSNIWNDKCWSFAGSSLSTLQYSLISFNILLE